MRRVKIAGWLAVVLLFLSGCTIYLVDVDGSLVGRVWQLLHGKQLEYGGLSIELPPNWLAIRSADSLELLHLAGQKTSEIFFVPVESNNPTQWEQSHTKWLESRRAAYVAEGYEQMPAPEVSVLGTSAVCLEMVLKKDRSQRRIECGIEEGRMLVTFKGCDLDIPALISIMRTP